MTGPALLQRLTSTGPTCGAANVAQRPPPYGLARSPTSISASGRRRAGRQRQAPETPPGGARSASSVLRVRRYTRTCEARHSHRHPHEPLGGPRLGPARAGRHSPSGPGRSCGFVNRRLRPATRRSGRGVPGCPESHRCRRGRPWADGRPPRRASVCRWHLSASFSTPTSSSAVYCRGRRLRRKSSIAFSPTPSCSYRCPRCASSWPRWA